MWAAGPPNEVVPSRKKTPTTVRSGTRGVGGGGVIGVSFLSVVQAARLHALHVQAGRLHYGEFSDPDSNSANESASGLATGRLFV